MKLKLEKRALYRYRRGHGFESNSDPILTWIISRLKFHDCLSCEYNCDDQSQIYRYFESCPPTRDTQMAVVRFQQFKDYFFYFNVNTRSFNRKVSFKVGSRRCYNFLTVVFNEVSCLQKWSTWPIAKDTGIQWTYQNSKQMHVAGEKRGKHVRAVSPINVIKTINVIPTINVITFNHKCNKTTNHKCNKICP